MSGTLPSVFEGGGNVAGIGAPRWLPATSAAGEAPHVSWLAVDGFGALAGVEVGLQPGLNVILGENEAGKSTLFDFLTGILFGFPQKKADEHFRLPVNGGTHGGKVAIAQADGGLVVERHGAPSKRLVLMHADGSPAEEGDLVRLLGGATRDLFRTVFALDLDDLRRLDGLADDEVREVLFSSSVLGQRRSAAGALAALEARRDALARPRQGGRANTLAAELAAARRELAGARSLSAGYLTMRESAATCTRQIATLRGELEKARALQRDLELLQRCWTTVVARRAAAEELAALEPLDAQQERALDLAERFDEVRSRLSGHLERLEHAEELRRRRAPLADSISARVARLGAWALDAASSGAEAISRARDELDHLLAAVTATRTAEDAAASAVQRAAGELARLGPPDEDSRLDRATGSSSTDLPGAAELQRGLAALRELRGLVSEHDALSRELEHAAERRRLNELSRGAARAARTDLGTLAALGAGVVLFAVAGVLLATGHTALGSATAVVAVLEAVVVLLAERARRRGGTEPSREAGAVSPSPLDGTAHDPSLACRVRALADRIAETAASCDLAEPVLSASIERAVSELELQLDARRRIDGLCARRLECETRLADERAEHESRERELCAALEDVRVLLARCGVPEDVVACRLAGEAGAPRGDTTQFAALLRELDDLRERLEGLARLDSEAAALLPESKRYDLALRDLAEQMGLEAPSGAGRAGEAGGAGAGERSDLLGRADAERIVSQAEALVRVARQLERRRGELAGAIAANDGELERVLGEGEHAEALRRDLASGRVREWAERAEAATSHVGRLEADHDELLREHERLRGALADLERSDEVARLESRVAQLDAALDEVMRDYLVTSAARLLVSRTLKRHEEERQPEVLTRAGEHFARVTGGRYARVVVGSAADTAMPSVQVLQENGTRLEAHHLSRGTVEQLYLCLRLALAESFAERIVPLPIVLDDVFVNFDPQRSAAMAIEVAHAAARHQVLVLTCHPHVAELLGTAAAALPGGRAATVVELHR